MKILQYVFVLISIIAFASCSKNAMKEFEKGNSLKAYEILYKKAKKGDLTRDEKEFFKTVIVDLVQEDSIKLFRNMESESLEANMEAYSHLKEIKERHEDIIALRYPLPSYNYYNPDMYDGLSYDVTEGLFNRAQERLDRTIQEENKIHARNAYTDLERLDDYHVSASYDVEGLKQECIRYGTVYTYVQLENDVSFGSNYIDRYFDDDEIRLTDSRWNKYHFRNDLDINYDRIVEVILRRADFDDDTDRSTKNFSERIITGYETETDTSGTTTETPIYGTVTATVTTEKITRELELTGYFNVQERGKNDDRDNLSEQYRETIEVYSLSGDERALSDSWRNKLDKAPEEFSREENFYREAIEDFLDEAERKLNRLD